MRRLAVFPLAVAMVLSGCGGDDADDLDSGPDSSATTVAETTAPETTAAETTIAQPADPVPNVVFSGVLESTPNVSGTLSFVVTDAGTIEELNLDAALSNFDCGGGMMRSISGAATHFFPDPIVIQAGRFSVSRSNLAWSGEFESQTSAHGTIRIDAGTDCANQPPSVTWTATAGQ